MINERMQELAGIQINEAVKPKITWGIDTSAVKSEKRIWLHGYIEYPEGYTSKDGFKVFASGPLGELDGRVHDASIRRRNKGQKSLYRAETSGSYDGLGGFTDKKTGKKYGWFNYEVTRSMDTMNNRGEGAGNFDRTIDPEMEKIMIAALIEDLKATGQKNVKVYKSKSQLPNEKNKAHMGSSDWY